MIKVVVVVTFFCFLGLIVYFGIFAQRLLDDQDKQHQIRREAWNWLKEKRL